MNRGGEWTPQPESGVEAALAGLAGPAPGDFAARVLQRVGIPRDRYDMYLHLEAPAGGLYVAYGAHAVTGAALGRTLAGPQAFEEAHRARTGRSAIPTTRPLPGLRTALRTGRAKSLRIDLPELTEAERAALDAVRTIPRGQLRPLAWVAREAALPDDAPVTEALVANPVPLLIPCHRVTFDNGGPCDLRYGPTVGAVLRKAEGIDDALVGLSRSGTAFLGSDTTRIYCHPTCAHARRITPPHQVPFRSARAAREAGYRACKSCRPIAA
ncbi:Ada metal-binding domain-containing protein [Streptomyces chattanoogensis]|uniref:Ada metal-binding domain-containing protein n=1 Tax=Streptomyces chattanoogensis TaxID=66876 RepID=UPI0036C155F7